jgi:Big-like domain-containing protein/VCBS repeat protein
MQRRLASVVLALPHVRKEAQEKGFCQFKITRYFAFIAVIAFFIPITLTASTLFQPAQVYGSGGCSSNSLAVADVNGDGKLDVVVVNLCLTTNNCHGGIGVLLGNGDGTFQNATAIDTGLIFANSVALADANRDGKQDILVLSGANCPPASCVSLVAMLLGNGDGSFGSPQIYSTGGYAAQKIVTADLREDGNVDLIVNNGSSTQDLSGPGNLAVLLNNGDGTFAAAQTFPAGGPMLAAADVNGDGHIDVISGGGSTFVVYLGDGSGTLQAHTYPLSERVSRYVIAIGDVNNDGRPDLILDDVPWSEGLGGVDVMLGNGDGTFQTPQYYPPGAYFPTSIAVADVNGDGNADVLVTHLCAGACNGSPVVVLLGNGDGTFKTPMRYYSGGKNALAMVVTDVNGDSKPDVIVANKYFSQTDHTIGSIGVLLGLAGVKTATTLSSSLNPSVYGQTVKLMVTVTSVGPFTPTGTVRFINTTTGLGLGYAPLSGGVATMLKSALPAGTSSIVAVYNGDSESTKSTSAPLNQIVNPVSTTTSLRSSSNPSKQGQTVTFIARVKCWTGIVVKGTVTFMAGSTTLGTIPLSSGIAAMSTTILPLGDTVITAKYTSSGNFRDSSASLMQAVQ